MNLKNIMDNGAFALLEFHLGHLFVKVPVLRVSCIQRVSPCPAEPRCILFEIIVDPDQLVSDEAI